MPFRQAFWCLIGLNPWAASIFAAVLVVNRSIGLRPEQPNVTEKTGNTIIAPESMINQTGSTAAIGEGRFLALEENFARFGAKIVQALSNRVFHRFAHEDQLLAVAVSRNVRLRKFTGGSGSQLHSRHPSDSF